MNFILIIIFPFLFACAKTSSDNIKTSGFYATYTVDGNNANSVTCAAQFQVSQGGTYIDLSSSDSITCNGNSMARSELAGIVKYTAQVAYSPGSVYTIVLTRSGESPYSSSVNLPETITTSNPTSNANVTKGTALTATWALSSDSSDSMRLLLHYDVNSNNAVSHYITDTAPEEGSLGWSSSETQVNPPSAGPWSGYINFVRFRRGSIASGLTGVIEATQTKAVNISIVD
jgi:hypothetical protein